MNERIRIRMRRKNGGVDVMVLMLHPMETGLREDAQGRPVPAHFITDARVTLDDQLLLDAELSIAVSKDPLLTFRLDHATPGATLRVVWHDNRGVTQEAFAVVPDE